MRYLIVAEAYRDLEQASGRLVLIERMAELVTQTPAELLPTVCYLCQGQIAPEFAGIDLGLAEKLAIRALGTATGTDATQVAARVREAGDLGQAGEQLLAETVQAETVQAGTGAGRPASLEVTTVVHTLRQIAAAEGQGSQGRKLELLGGLLGRATPLEGRYLLRLVTGNLRLGIGTPTILDALAQVYAGGRAQRKVLERGYNICCDIGLVAATLVSGGLAAVEKLHVQAGNPVRAMLAQRLSDASEILAKLGGRCSAEYKYDGVRVQAHRMADGQIELWTRRLEEISTQFPDVVEVLKEGLGPREVILEGEVVAYDAATDELRPFGEVMLRRRKHGIEKAMQDVPVGLFCFELLYADGEDLTMLPYPERRARLAAAITPGPRLRLTTATEVDRPGRAGRGVLPGGHRRLRGAGVQVGRGRFHLPGRRARLAVDQAQAGLPHRTVRHRRPGRHRRVRRARPPHRRVRRGAAGRLRRRRRHVPRRVQVRGRVHRRRPGHAARPAGTAGPPGQARPGRRPAGTRRVVRTRAGARDPQRRTHPVAEQHRRLGPDRARQRRLAMRFPRFTGRWRDDKSGEDATTTRELIELFLGARHTATGSSD